MKKEKAWKVWAVFRRSGHLVCPCRSLGIAEMVAANCAGTIKPATLTLTPPKTKGKARRR